MVAVTRATLARHLQSSKTTNTVVSGVLKKKRTKKTKKPVVSSVVKKNRTRKTKNTVQQCATTSTTSVPLERYNEVAGRSDIIDALAYDRYGNPTGREYDLGRDGAFTEFNILIAQFYSDFQFTDAAMQLPIDALNAKGFQVKLVKTEDECLKELASNRYAIAWIISTLHIGDPKFISALTDFHSAGGAIFLFADNTPYVCHASEFLRTKFGITVEGDYYGNQTMTYQEKGHQETGHFGQHEIFTGIKNLFEGITICHPVYSTTASREVFNTIATASDGNSSIAVYDPPATSKDGRLCLDCGFTKLYINWDTAGTARYIVNATCWLLGIRERSW